MVSLMQQITFRDITFNYIIKKSDNFLILRLVLRFSHPVSAYKEDKLA
jgi:hypothetical protein